MKLLNTDTPITRLTLKDQLTVDPYKALALLETLLLFFAVMALVLFVAHRVGITDTFKSALLYSGTFGASIGMAFNMYREAALSEWTLAAPVSPLALQNAMLSLKYSERQPGVYGPKKPMFTLLHRCDSERITVTTLNDKTHFTGPANKLKALSAMPLTDTPDTQ